MRAEIAFTKMVEKKVKEMDKEFSSLKWYRHDLTVLYHRIIALSDILDDVSKIFQGEKFDTAHGKANDLKLRIVQAYGDKDR